MTSPRSSAQHRGPPGDTHTRRHVHPQAVTYARRRPGPPGKAARPADPGRPPEGPLECTVRGAVTGTGFLWDAGCQRLLLGDSGASGLECTACGSTGRAVGTCGGSGGGARGKPDLERVPSWHLHLQPRDSTAARPPVSAPTEGTTPSLLHASREGRRQDAEQTTGRCRLPISSSPGFYAQISLGLAPNASPQ